MAELLEIEQDRTILVEGIVSWRSIASGQVDKERTKYKTSTSRSASRGSVFGSLFGSSLVAPSMGMEDSGEPPISLSVEEMRELELIALDRVSNAELSPDSRLCDIKFVLGSFDTQLTAYDLCPLLGLEMGKVAASFQANVDGSYVFDCSMRSLTITDRVTPQSCFPCVLQNQGIPDVIDEQKDSFHAYIAKRRSGDQVFRSSSGTRP